MALLIKSMLSATLSPPGKSSCCHTKRHSDPMRASYLASLSCRKASFMKARQISRHAADSLRLVEPFVPEPVGRFFSVGSRAPKLQRQVSCLSRASSARITAFHSFPGSEYALFDQNVAVKAPIFLSDKGPSTLPIAACTAWLALFERC
jgi:hypothetical protein